MLLEASDSSDPNKFKETEVFKKCLEMGIIPRSESDLAQRTKKSPVHPSYISSESDPKTTKIKDMETSGDILNLYLLIYGMWCPACAWVIDEALKKNKGIVNSICNFSTDRLLCEYDPILTSPSQVMDAISSLGYKAFLPGDSDQTKESKREFIRFSISSFLTINVMMLSFALYSGFFTDLSYDAINKISWPMFIMASGVLFYGGLKIFQKALAGIGNAAYSMETLISVGALSAYFYSCYNFFVGSIHQYFDTASMLITMVLLGKLLERRAKNRIKDDLEKFFSLMPRKVRICTALNPGGRFVNIDQLEKNDIYRLEESEIVPADGVILEGNGSVDESSLTGEALPVIKEPGDRLKSGTTVIKGTFKVKTESVGDDSILGQMIRIMEDALGQKTPIEGSTDKIIRWFVPAIIFIAFVTGVASVALGFSREEVMIRFVTVLVIACPCALGIAIPLARVAGVSLAGKKGILVKNFSAFSKSGKVDSFVFDKTGTITLGNWTLIEVYPLGKFTEDQLLSIAAGVEKDCEHYIAVEIKARAERKHLKPSEVDDIVCHDSGATGWIGKKEIKIGSRNFLFNEIKKYFSHRTDLQFTFDKIVSKVYMSYGGKPCATFLFGDKIRQSAFSTIQKLRNLGYHLILISGDGDATTKAIGKKLGIDESYGGKLPQEKAFLIGDMQQRDYCVAMVGDGVNDAPALAKADLSFAIHSGNNLGKEAADVTLMRGDPGQVLDFLELATRVKRKISQNLVFSIIYNTISIPVAMSGLLTPLIAVSAMLMSSLTVIGNTLLLIKRAG